MKITIYGTSCCSKCGKVLDLVKEIVEENNLEAEIEKVNDPVIASRKGIMSLPALAVNEEVKSTGKVLKKEEIKEILNVQ